MALACACLCNVSVWMFANTIFGEGGRSVPNVVTSRLQHAYSVYN